MYRYLANCQHKNVMFYNMLFVKVIVACIKMCIIIRFIKRLSQKYVLQHF